MKTKKIKFWARLGQVSFWMFQYFHSEFSGIDTYDPSKYSGTFVETAVHAIISILFFFIFSEAIVRLIIYFSELLER